MSCHYVTVIFPLLLAVHPIHRTLYLTETSHSAVAMSIIQVYTSRRVATSTAFTTYIILLRNTSVLYCQSAPTRHRHFMLTLLCRLPTLYLILWCISTNTLLSRCHPTLCLVCVRGLLVHGLLMFTSRHLVLSVIRTYRTASYTSMLHSSDHRSHSMSITSLHVHRWTDDVCLHDCSFR